MTDLIAKNNEIAPPGFEPGSEDLFDEIFNSPPPKSPMLDRYIPQNNIKVISSTGLKLRIPEA